MLGSLVDHVLWTTVAQIITALLTEVMGGSVVRYPGAVLNTVE